MTNEEKIRQIHDTDALANMIVLNCMMCGKPIKIVPVRGNSRFTDVFFCMECEKKVMDARKNHLPVKEKEDEFEKK